MIKLDDFLTKKKEPAQVLDLSKVKITSKDEFKKYFDKIPDSKVKPEKILPETIKIKDKDFTFVAGKREEKQIKEWNYPDPTPPDMKGAKLEDLCPVNIDWKMLTTLRPKTKVEEDMFSRLVQLGKLDLKYQQLLQREKITDWVRKTKTPKSSIVEMRVLSCKECGEDFCDGSMCSKLMYDNFFRPQPTVSGPSQNLFSQEAGETKKKKKKKKRRKGKTRKRSHSRGKKRKLGKNSIFNRPARRGCSRDHSRSKENIERPPQRRALSSTRSFSTERKRAAVFEGRSKSAPRIHFNCEVSSSKTTRYEFTSDSGPTISDYSSQSDSESPHFHRRFITSHLRLSGRRKLLSARVAFSNKNQHESPKEKSHSRFVRRCSLHKRHYHEVNMPDTGNDSSSSSSTPTRLRSLSKSPERTHHETSASVKYPSVIKIQFDECFMSPKLRLPEKIVLPNKDLNKNKDTNSLKIDELKKSFSKIQLELDQNSVRNDRLLSRKPKAGVCVHILKSRAPRLFKFSGSHVKSSGLLEMN